MSEDVPLLYESEPHSVRLMNTVWADRRGIHDVLGVMADFRSWARLCGAPLAKQVTSADLGRARLLRDALRRLAAASTDDDRPGAVDEALPVADALAVVNGFLSGQRPELRTGSTGDQDVDFDMAWRSEGPAFDQWLTELALEGAELVARQDGREVNACQGPGCVLYFVKDGGRRAWCSPGCGNRARVARHYRSRRKRPESPSDR